MATSIPPEALLFVGEVVAGRFEIKDFIAPGGFGFVFEALDRETGSVVAVKFLKFGVPASATLEFEGECAVLEILRSATSVVDSYGKGRHQLSVATTTGASATIETPYVVLELATACLAELVVHRNRLPWPDRLALYRGVVRGVHQMHLQRIVHRDLKSENVLVFAERRVAEAKVSDFGRSRILTRKARFAADEYEHGRGDLRFAPPELLWLLGIDNERSWRRVDLYHLGSVLFELATGQGITSLVIGNPAVVIQHAKSLSPADRAHDFAASLPDLRSRYEFAFALFRQEIPPAIRHEAGQLLAQLCDPDPSRREIRRLPGSSRRSADLQWIIRRVDILLLLLRTPRSQRRKSRKVG